MFGGLYITQLNICDGALIAKIVIKVYSQNSTIIDVRFDSIIDVRFILWNTLHYKTFEFF